MHGPSDGTYDRDAVRLTDPGIDFGDTIWLPVGAPLGIGSVDWEIECGTFTVDVVGTLHLDGVEGQYGRVEVGYWNGDLRLDVRHSQTRRAPDNGHHEWPVRISNAIDVYAVEVCTELSDDGVLFERVSCSTHFAGD